MEIMVYEIMFRNPKGRKWFDNIWIFSIICFFYLLIKSISSE